MGCDVGREGNATYNTSFNPRTRMGCDQQLTHVKDSSSLFQSTHPHGVRQHHFGWLSWVWLFQSTHPHGVRRTIPNNTKYTFVVSIHAPAWGATKLAKTQVYLQTFQSTHPHGVRPSSLGLSPLVILFQSTHPHGVRHLVKELLAKS